MHELPIITVEYREIVGLPGYIVSNAGTVWSCWNKHGQMRSVWHPIAQNPDIGGYLHATLRRRDRKAITKSVSRLVLECFVGPCPDGMECCHNDGNNQNNFVWNLRWDTCLNNQREMSRHGTRARGEQSGKSKLTWDSVRQIRQLLNAGGRSHKDIGKQFGVSHNAIYSIATKRTWTE